MDSELTFSEHVSQLVRTFFLSIGVLIGAAALVHAYRESVIHFLLLPLEPRSAPLQFLSPLDPLMFVLKVDFVLGFFIAMPIIAWLIWRYIKPATEVRSWLVLVVLIVSTVLTAGAVMYSYNIVIPIVLEFMNVFITEGTTAAYTAQGYLSFFLATTVLLVFVFQIPLLIVFLSALRIVDPVDIIKNRLHIYTGILVLSAVITPTTDVITLGLVTLPTIALTEIGIQTAKFLRRNESVQPSCRNENEGQGNG